MNMSGSELVALGIIGLLAGSLAGLLVKRKREGFGWITNLIFGLLGAFVGGIIFDRLNINLGLEKITIELNQIAAAFVGALLVIIVASFVESQRRSPS